MVRVSMMLEADSCVACDKECVMLWKFVVQVGSQFVWDVGLVRYSLGCGWYWSSRRWPLSLAMEIKLLSRPVWCVCVCVCGSIAELGLMLYTSRSQVFPHLYLWDTAHHPHYTILLYSCSVYLTTSIPLGLWWKQPRSCSWTFDCIYRLPYVALLRLQHN